MQEVETERILMKTICLVWRLQSLSLFKLFRDFSSLIKTSHLINLHSAFVDKQIHYRRWWSKNSFLHSNEAEKVRDIYSRTRRVCIVIQRYLANWLTFLNAPHIPIDTPITWNCACGTSDGFSGLSEQLNQNWSESHQQVNLKLKQTEWWSESGLQLNNCFRRDDLVAFRMDGWCSSFYGQQKYFLIT